MWSDLRKFWFNGVYPMWPDQYEDSSASRWMPLTEVETPTQKSLGNLVQEKENYVRQIVSNIQTERDTFICNIYKINKSIDIIKVLALKFEHIQQKLEKMVEEKEKKWNSYLEKCQKASFWLENLRDHYPNDTLMSVEAFDNICNNMFIKSIEEVEKSELLLSLDDLALLNVLQNFFTVKKTLPVSCPSRNENSIIPKFILGGVEEESVQFCRPWGVCTDAQGRILVCDRSNDRVVVFDSSGQYVFKFGQSGSGKGEFSRPAGITVDNENRIIVCDKDNHRVQVFNIYGVYLFEFGEFGSGYGKFNYPWDVAVNSLGNIAITDSKNHRVQLFDSQGKYLTQYKSKGLDLPRGLAFCPDGRLMITDFNNHKIFVLNQNFKKIKTYCRQGRGPGKLFRPQGITYLKDGYFAISDSKNFRIQILDQNENFVYAFGVEGSEPGQFNCPQGIAHHPNGNLIVVDLSNNRVQVFPGKEIF